MQSKLEELCRWSEQWQISVFYIETRTMLMNSCNHVLYAPRSLHIGESAVKITDHVEDLGVTAEYWIRFDSQMNQIVAMSLVHSLDLICCKLLQVVL